MRYICDKQRHLICCPYSVQNLHRMADDLGIKRCWFHASPYPHYDIPKLRVAELQGRCEVVSPKVIVRIARGDIAAPEEMTALSSSG